MRPLIVRTLALAAATALLAGCAVTKLTNPPAPRAAKATTELTQGWVRVPGYDQPCPVDYPRFLYTEWVSSAEQNTICGK